MRIQFAKHVIKRVKNANLNSYFPKTVLSVTLPSKIVSNKSTTNANLVLKDSSLLPMVINVSNIFSSALISLMMSVKNVLLDGHLLRMVLHVRRIN